MKKSSFKLRIAAIILISAGYGWAGAHYIPANSPLVAYSFQLIVIAFLLIVDIKYLSVSENEKKQRNWPVIALNIFSILSLVVNVLNIIHGAYATDPNSYGSHNTLADLVPISFIISAPCYGYLPSSGKLRRFNQNEKLLQYLKNTLQ